MLERFVFPKNVVKNSGYIGAIIVFLMISAIAAAVFIPKLAKPVSSAPVANLEAKVDYMNNAYPGYSWIANVTVYEDSEASAHNVNVTLVTPFCGNLSASESLLLPYDKHAFPFRCEIPQTFSTGTYYVNVVIVSNESKATESKLVVNVIPRPPEFENQTNSTNQTNSSVV